jgi:hypothetical protein
MNYMHKNIVIVFNERTARFETVVNNATLKSSSLAGIKKKIDDALAMKFEPFKALNYSVDNIVPFEVVGVGKGVSRYDRGTSVFLSKSTTGVYSTEHTTVVPDTPEARKAIKAWQAARKEAERVRTEAEKKERAARNAIPQRKADGLK